MRKGKIVDKKTNSFTGSSKLEIEFEDGKTETVKVKVHEGYLYQRGTLVEMDAKGRLTVVSGGAPNPFAPR